jgi:hypothetical protein
MMTDPNGSAILLLSPYHVYNGEDESSHERRPLLFVRASVRLGYEGPAAGHFRHSSIPEIGTHDARSFSLPSRLDILKQRLDFVLREQRLR